MRLRLPIFFFVLIAVSQTVTSGTSAQPRTERHTDGPLVYRTVKGDPLKARIYTLPNGLTVYLTVNKNEPRIQTFVAVRAGSKDDPSDATGLAHYLEHMLFKGTDRYGSLDYSKEKPLLDEVEQLFEVYRKTTDDAKRKELYHQIDSVSGLAAKFAIPGEFDKMVTSLGAAGTNAYTSNDQTVYVNDIPSNQLRKWVTIEAERYRNPVLRLFHTELEAVYEEKNRGLDNDGRVAWEMMLASLYPSHPYGYQSTLGTVEHLKNPSITRIKEYFSKNYVPNNMAICLSGDLDPDQTITWIMEAFGGLQPKPIQRPEYPQEKALTAPVIKEVYGPDAENVQIGFRFPGEGTREAKLLTMVDMILSNTNAGLIDLNLNQQQKVLNAGCSPNLFKERGAHIFRGQPKQGQSLEEVKDLILGQIELVKQGKFDESLLKAIINDFTINQIRQYETNSGRANAFVDAFINGDEWETYINRISELNKITKKEIVEFANKWYGNNYVVVYKRSGPKRDVVKVVKPEITPVTLNKNVKSDFLQKVEAMAADDIKPRFIDYKKDIKTVALKNGIQVYSLKNDENELFYLYYLLDMGKRHDKKMAYAINYLSYLGTDKISAEDVKKKLYELGCTFNVSVSNDQVYVYLTGLDKNYEAGVKLFEDLLANAKPDDAALTQLVERTLKGRRDAKKNKNTILQAAMRNYGTFGKYNPFTDELSETELRALTAKELTDKLHSLTSYEHRVLYYGPRSEDQLKSSLAALHKTPATLKAIPTAADYTRRDMNENKVYFVNYDMAQAEVYMLSKAFGYSPEQVPAISLYNEYFGGSMSSIVFQTIRESKALAYAVSSWFTNPSKKQDPHYVTAYVGTQADKLPETMESMFDLFHNMPQTDEVFHQAKSALKNSIETQRIIRTDILFDYERARRLGLSDDIRKSVYEAIPKMTFQTVADFQRQYVKDRKYTILVLGDKKKINMDVLKKYGDVEELTLEEVFGY